ncbi:HTH-type transcriptional regulator DmlR [Pseudoprimorskyibacter insulae]|uniref:HTH-type transcriptional regulator DmlR n=2 Tax=Pseudoprimorskyibacter insulae TaxID=1695997 RepID=A0A2R8B179_9RHOB|nr:HTH-type transcriptional regulator DmlR [Pseudoprimorskyibacter insulae]
MQWEDLRFFLETERTGRLSRAAKRLGVSHTTVARHLDRLEAAAGAPLFERTGDGLVLTETGLRILPKAKDMEQAALAVSDQLTGGGAVAGKVRVGAPDGIGNAVLSHILPHLLKDEPGLELALVPVPMTHKLWRRDVDIAISLDRPSSGRLVMRKLIDYDLRLYASPEFLHAGPPEAVEDLGHLPFVGYVDDLLYTDELDFNRKIGGLRVVYRAATVKAQLDAVRAGVGLGVLPCFMARGTGLVPVLPDTVTFRRTYWLLYPEDYRDLARIRRVADYIYAETQAKAAQFAF